MKTGPIDSLAAVPVPYPKQEMPAVAYFSMEFAIDQALKTYAGGLGYVAGSYLRAAYRQGYPVVGVGILWSFGYYDQQQQPDGALRPALVRKNVSFLSDTGVMFRITVHGAPVNVKAYLLPSETFHTAPLYLLTTDIPENDELSRTISHQLYDPCVATRIAQSILLGVGGEKLLEVLGKVPMVYHLNEAHGLPLAFRLYGKYGDLSAVRNQLVFTTHTPEPAGNDVRSFRLLDEMSFFAGLPVTIVKQVLNHWGDELNYTAAALVFSGKANAVSKLHLDTARKIWRHIPEAANLVAITNGQDKEYWVDPQLDQALRSRNKGRLAERKKELKRALFAVVADQCGKLFRDDVLTIVWARRFAGYKRAELLLNDLSRFMAIISRVETPVQVIWAGKPYPQDQPAMDQFNRIRALLEPLPGCAVLFGYELGLSGLLKRGSDVWLNTPRLFHEASGTSGMTAVMNGSVLVSVADGWVREFADPGKNCFLVDAADQALPPGEVDRLEAENLYRLLEDTVIPGYYHDRERWLRLMMRAAAEIVPRFDADRMVADYMDSLYNGKMELYQLTG